MLAAALPPIHVPTSTVGLAITAVQCMNLLAGANEMQSPTGYSKFAPSGASIPSRRGMLIIYSPALLTSVAMASSAPATGRASLIAGLLVIHFAKRVFEVLFVHKYSGSMGPAAYGISTFYSLLVLLICGQTQHVPLSVYEAGASHIALLLGLSMFVVGQAGNGWHHLQLARMRGDTSDALPAVPATPSTDGATRGEASPVAAPPTPHSPRAYAVPRGGLFELVAAPHYLFEIVAWFGVGLAAQQLNALLVAGGMASYLSGRAVACTAWYRKRFGTAYPAGRKHLVPFVF